MTSQEQLTPASSESTQSRGRVLWQTMHQAIRYPLDQSRRYLNAAQSEKPESGIKKLGMNLEGGIRRSAPAFERTARIGDLYDIRRESFLGETLLKSDAEGSEIETIQLGHNSYEIVTEDSTSSKCKALKMEGSLQLSFWGADVNVSASFAKNDNESSHIERVSLVFHITTCNDCSYFSRLKHKINTEILSSGINATHAVYGIDYGAVSILTCEHETSEQKSSTKASMEADVKYLLSAHVKLKGEYDAETQNTHDKYRFTCESDVIPSVEDSLPMTFADAFDFVKSTPKYLAGINKDKTGRGKGVPQAYFLIPLRYIANMLKVKNVDIPMFNEIDEPTVLACRFSFDAIAMIKRRITTLKHNEQRKPSIEFTDGDRISERFQLDVARFKITLCKLVLDVKSGVKTPEELVKSVGEEKTKLYKKYDQKLDAAEESIEAKDEDEANDSE